MKFFIETFGCQMNRSDSDLMELSFLDSGFERAQTQNEADIVVFNTCSVRKSAEDRAKARLTEARAHVKKRKGIVVAAGCMAQRIAEDLVKQKKCDIAIGPYQSPSIGKIVERYLNGERESIFASQEKDDFSERLRGETPNTNDTPWHRFITITHGCENFCTYCIVPYVRGKLISFPSEKIIANVKAAVKSGAREITLLGQNVNQYGQDNGEIPFYQLLARCAETEGLERLHFLTSHPKDFNPEIVDVIKDHPSICRGIHLPMQSGSDRILKMMNRSYTVADYRRIIEKIKELGEYSLTTDIIVGFPSETEDEFRDTLNLVTEIGYADAFMYAFSPRSGTEAAKLDELIDKKVKLERLQILIDAQRKRAVETLSKRIGMTEKIIIESVSRRNDNELMGRSHLFHPVITSGSSDEVGKTVEVTILNVKGTTLYGSRT